MGIEDSSDNAVAASNRLTSLGYIGQEGDLVSGLSLHGARWYDPNLGRFISQDPSGYDGGMDMNLYRYAFNNVSSFADPTGLVGFQVPYNGGSTSSLGLSGSN
ncbi:RHS repeat-associated core domain-containing protein [bacterium]|nr:RHS repeat-associated core domain-containing protein [bacterium]